MENYRINKFLSIISALSLLLIVLIINNSPLQQGYELSIYSGYPLYLWILFTIPISIPFLQLINQKVNSFTYLLFTITLITIIIFFTIPFFKGYIFYGAGDTHFHLGMIKNIIDSGHIGAGNPYPIIHLIKTNINMITGIKIETVSLFIPPIFIIIYIASMFLLSKSLNFSSEESIYVALFACISVLGIWMTTEYIMPSLQSFLCIPFILFIFIKSRSSKINMEFSVLLIITLTFISFFHPETTIFLCVIFLSIILVGYLTKKFKIDTKIRLYSNKKIFTPMIFLIVATIAWFSSSLRFGGTVISLYQSFVLNLKLQNTPIENLAGGFQITLLDGIVIIIQKYGIILLFLGIGGLITLFTAKNIIQKKKIDSKVFTLTLIFIALIITNLLFLMKNISIGVHVARQLKYPLLIATILLGVYFYRNLKYIKLKKSIPTIAVILLIFTLPLFAVVNTYPTPQTHDSNYGVTNSNIDGMTFFLNHRMINSLYDQSNYTYPTVEVFPKSYQVRYADYLYGYENKTIDMVGLYANYGTSLIPEHFGYTNSSLLGNFYTKNSYLLLYPPAKTFYPTAYANYKNLWQYSPEDFNILNNDKSVEKLYSNGNFEIHKISPLLAK